MNIYIVQIIISNKAQFDLGFTNEDIYKYQASWYQFVYDSKFGSYQWLCEANPTTVKL